MEAEEIGTGTVSKHHILLVKPAQAGKTGTVLDLIMGSSPLLNVTPLSPYKEQMAKALNIVFAGNNTELVRQTTARFGMKIPSTELSSKTVTKANFDAVSKECVENGTRVIIVPSNRTRMDNILSILTRIENGDIVLNGPRVITVWVDEADLVYQPSYVKDREGKWVKSFAKKDLMDEITNHPLVGCTVLVTATPSPLLNTTFKGGMEIIPLSRAEVVPSSYLSMDDCTVVPTPSKLPAEESATEFLQKCLETIMEEEGSLPKVLFAPGDMTKKSHDEIRTFLCNEHNYNVIVINQDAKRICIPNESNPVGYDTIDIQTDGLQISEWLSNTFRTYCKGSLLAVTGNKMFSRGTTLCSGSTEKQTTPLIFTHGILRCDGPVAGYQRLARMLGNLGELYKEHKIPLPTIYLNKGAANGIKLQESYAFQLPVMAFESGNTSVSEGHLNIIENESVTEVEGVSREWFDGFVDGHINPEDVITRAQKIGMKRPQRARLIKVNDNGFVESNYIPGKWGVLEAKTLKRSRSCGLSKKIKYKIWATYTNPSDPKTLKYCLVWKD